MAILRGFVKFLKFFLLPVILANSSAQKCGIPDSQNPLTISASPGFLSGAIQHISNQECTESGTCLHVPHLCPLTSCCVSSTPANVSFPSSLSQSKCGCWDSVRKTCKPVSNFHIGYSSCDPQNGVGIWSKTEIYRGSRGITSNICEANTAEVHLEAYNKGRTFAFQIKILACMQQPKGSRPMGPPRVDVPNTLTEVVGEVESDLRRSDMLTEFRDFLSRKRISSAITNHTSSEDGLLGKVLPSICDNASENHTFSMSSSFLDGATNNFLELNTGICSSEGLCVISRPDCLSASCCLVPTSGDGNYSEDSCECVGIPDNQTNTCLVNHKIYRTSSTVCTETWERVQRSISVRLPSSGFNRCASGGESWEMADVNFETNESLNLEAVIEIRKCILSGANQEYVEIEEIVKAELSVDIVSKMLKQME